MRSAALATVILVAACGKDDLRYGVANGPGRFDHPTDFDRTTCRLGAMQGLDPQGVYHFRVDYGDGFLSGAGSARIDVDVPGLTSGVLVGGTATEIVTDDHQLFLYRLLDPADPENGPSRTLLLCDRDGDSLRGQWAYCNVDECALATAEARKVERLAEAAAYGLTEVGGLDTRDDEVSLNVRVADKLAFLVRGNAPMQVIDVSDPRQPRLKSEVPPMFLDQGEYYNDVKIVHSGGERFALVASNQRGMVVYRAVTPTFLADLGSFGLPGERGANVHTLFVDGDIAYLANREFGLEVWDISALPSARLLDDFFPVNAPDGAFLHDLYVEGARAYLNFWNAGMVVVDVSNPSDVVEVGRFVDYGERTSHSSWVTTVDGRRIAAHGDEQWGSHLRLVDVTEDGQGFAAPIGEWQTRPEVSAHNVMAFGREVIMSHYQDGVRILDISVPEQPRQTAWFNTWPGHAETTGYNFFEGAIGIDVDPLDNLIYVADAHRDLIILRR